MRVPNRFSLRVSLAGVLIGAVLLSSLFLGGAVFSMWRRSLREDLERRLAELAATSVLLIDASAHAQLTNPADMQGPAYAQLRDKLAAVRQRVPEVHFLYTLRWTPGEASPRFVLDTGLGAQFSPLGQLYWVQTPSLLAAFAAPFKVHVVGEVYSDEYGTFLSAFAPILRPDGSLEAVLGIDIDASRLAQLERRLLVLVGCMTLATAALMALLAWWVSRWFSQPLQALSRDMARIQTFELDGRVELDTRISEVVTMKETFDNMKQGLRSFRKYVPRDLVAELIALKKEALLGTEKAEVTVFFCDLANFTTASELLTGEDLSRLLTAYFALVTRALSAHGATVDKFIGDAVMAFWNAPKPRADHAYLAAMASLEVQRGMERLIAEWQQEGMPPLSARIGLNSGTVQVGNVGDADRLSYTVLGDPVNLASRLESLNKFYGTRILVGEATLAQLGDRLPWRPVDVVAVKGKTQSVQLGELVETAPGWWPAYRQAWDRYRAGEWAAALAGFEAVRTDTGADGVSVLLAARCRRFLERGVPAGWTGTWVMQDK